MFKKYTISIIIVLLLLSLIGCNNNDKIIKEEKNIEKQDSEVYIRFNDGKNREVILKTEPKRIISVAPSITETIFALDAEDKLIGRTDYCNYPKEASNIESIGSLREPNIEKIVEMKPDIVLASTHFKKENLDKLEELNIPVAMIISQNDFEGVYNNIINIGKIVNKNNEAKKIINEMKTKVKYVKDKVSKLDKKQVYYIVGYGESGNYTATGDVFISKMIEMAGGENIAKEAKGWKYSLEKLVEKNPEIIITDDKFDIENGISKSNGYKDLEAVKKGNIYPIDGDVISRMGPRLADGLVDLAKLIHVNSFN